MELLFLGLYLLAQFLLVLYVSRYIKSETDFLLAGRNVPTSLLAFSIFATWFGAETCIGSSAAVLTDGLSGSKAEPLGYGMCLFLLGLLVAPRIYNSKYATLGDFVKDRYGSSSEALLIWVLLPSSIMWAAAQIRAFGQVISATSEIPIDIAIPAATIFVVVYTYLGGLLGDILTDVIQGIILSLSLILIFVFALSDLGGLSAFEAVEPARLNLIGADQSIWERIDSWLIPIFGSLVAQELISRVLAAKNKKIAVRSSFYGCGIYLVMGSIPVALGLLGPQFNLSLGESEQFLPALAESVLPKYLYIIFAGALISAILSTIDSILLAIASLVSHNFIVPRFGITDPKQKLLSVRLVTAASGFFCFILAMMNDSVYELVESASSFGTSGIIIISVVGLYWKLPSAMAANIALISGLVFTILFEYLVPVQAPFLLGLVLVFFVYAFSDYLLGRRKSLLS